MIVRLPVFCDMAPALGPATSVSFMAILICSKTCFGSTNIKTSRQKAESSQRKTRGSSLTIREGSINRKKVIHELADERDKRSIDISTNQQAERSTHLGHAGQQQNEASGLWPRYPRP